jgi:hypothetical protein
MKRQGYIQMLYILAMSLGLSIFFISARADVQAANQILENIFEPVVLGPYFPTQFNGSLLDLPTVEGGATSSGEIQAPRTTNRNLPVYLPNFVDPVAQIWQGTGQMPEPDMNFPGLVKSQGGGWIPPDTNGEVGANHYIQVVNIGIGIYDKSTGNALYVASYNTFFQYAPSPCNNSNRGDVIVLYDHLADRWIVTDFSLPDGGPYYECIAISQTGDPISGGWWYYAFQAKPVGDDWHDYPKLSVWPDAYYLSANIFNTDWVGSQVWALDRAAMLDGDPLTAVSFGPLPEYGSLLPANLEGELPPTDSPNYFATIGFPNLLQLWEFHVDWVTPGNSTFIGPVELIVENFGYISEIVQPAPGDLLDSLGDRPMMQLQYRNFGNFEALWVNHTVGSGGVAGVRWYEVRDPGGTPYVYQQGTYSPDGENRWMGSLAIDGDGNMALGYSVSSENVIPAIRYTGRLNGESLGGLAQGEAELFQGTGVQVGSTRWGDYSSMSIDPVDDCTFWYTNEYLLTNSSNWVTRIGSFRFPSCGQPKGAISGEVYDSLTMLPIGGVEVVAEGITTTFTTQTDSSGIYTMTLPGATYTITAGPLEPGYPVATVVSDINVNVGETTIVDISLVPSPALVSDTIIVDDNGSGGNGNGFPEPGEKDLSFYISALNFGATAATNGLGFLSAITPGVDVSVNEAEYPDIFPGDSEYNITPYVISLSTDIDCGTPLEFLLTLTTDQGVYDIAVAIDAAILLPRATYFSDDMENGAGNWSSGGTPNNWGITTAQYNSPTHSFTDSPTGNYNDNSDTWLQSPVFDLANQRDFELNFWQRYITEEGYDFVFAEYSIDGGVNWNILRSYTGFQANWSQENVDLSGIDGSVSASFRFRLQSDEYLNEDGYYLDDVDLTYIPYECSYTAVKRVFLPIVSK